MALMAFAETETKVIKTLLPLVHSRHVQVSWRRGDTLLQQHRRHNTGELPNAHAHSGIEHCQGECKNGEISCCQRRHFGVHDGIGHAKPPQLGVGNHHDGRYLLCQRAEVIQSLLLPFLEKNSHGNPLARDELGPLHVVLLVHSEELLVWSVATENQV